MEKSMINPYTLGFLLSVTLAFQCTAQTREFILPLAGTVNSGRVHEDWNAALQENDAEIGDEYQHSGQLNGLKDKLQSRLHKTSVVSSGERGFIDTPYLWKGIQAQNYNGSVPNDNDIAVSNSGYLISVMNTNIFKYNLNNDSLLGLTTLQAFSTALNNIHSKYDPKVIYDPDQNKFIIVFLSGFSSVATDIIVGFSQSDDPNGLWNLYSLPGNPLNDSLWSDFPAIALTSGELFITVNHLVDNESWQTGWRRTVIWQVNKFTGFNGDSLKAQLHYDINFGSSGMRNLCPVKGGSHLYGADIYFLSNRNLDISNDTFFLVHITDTINAPQQALTVQPLLSNTVYYVPINAKQPWTSDLSTNDSRVLAAFYENDRIQFVGNTTDTLTATSAAYHGVISNVASVPELTLHTISNDTAYYGYPNIAYAGNGNGDNLALIDLLHSGANLFPGYSSLVTDGDGSFSAVKEIKAGLSYHAVIPGDQRWGDYTGAQRNYLLPGNVWVNGSYCQTNHKMSTWASELALLPAPSNVPHVDSLKAGIRLYPNPTMDILTFKFEVTAYFICNFEVYDNQGRLIKLLLNEKVSPGLNEFSFSSVPLPSGEYVLRISSSEGIVAADRFIKQ